MIDPTKIFTRTTTRRNAHGDMVDLMIPAEGGNVMIAAYIQAEIAADILNALHQVKFLRAALQELRASNGYGFNVPPDYADDQAWIVTVRAIRACAAALQETQ